MIFTVLSNIYATYMLMHPILTPIWIA